MRGLLVRTLLAMPAILSVVGMALAIAASADPCPSPNGGGC